MNKVNTYLQSLTKHTFSHKKFVRIPHWHGAEEIAGCTGSHHVVDAHPRQGGVNLTKVGRLSVPKVRPIQHGIWRQKVFELAGTIKTII